MQTEIITMNRLPLWHPEDNETGNEKRRWKKRIMSMWKRQKVQEMLLAKANVGNFSPIILMDGWRGNTPPWTWNTAQSWTIEKNDGRIPKADSQVFYVEWNGARFRERRGREAAESMSSEDRIIRKNRKIYWDMGSEWLFVWRLVINHSGRIWMYVK